jgi:uncharacterized protein YPO0396
MLMGVSKMMMKKLCRIKLVNWHYFVHETISVSGSFLVSGENTSGKSTILDAIQLVLTTNTRKFNLAANEKSNRDLKGYVRCKTGEEGNTYMRKGSIISYVALEFFEEKTSKYFTMGVKVDSPDEESNITTKWFVQEAKFEDLSFITGERPSTTDEFRRKGDKIEFIHSLSEAKARFARRMGNLEPRFFDMIPKSLAFKPMENVKEFINKFILPEKAIEVATLRSNIAALKEFEDLMEITREKISYLKTILEKNEEINLKDKEMRINEILIKKAEIELLKLECAEMKKQNYLCEQNIITEQKNRDSLKASLEYERERFMNLQIAMGQNHAAKLLNDTQNRIRLLENDKRHIEEGVKKLKNMLEKTSDALALISKHQIFIMGKEELLKLLALDIDTEEKIQSVFNLEKDLREISGKYNSDNVRIKDLLERYRDKKAGLEAEIKNLRNKKLTYPENTMNLKLAIEKEFLRQGIRGEARIFSDLLEITDSKWQNAVEGYLNTQRFYIIVEPEHYKVALDVYNKVKKEVHTVGLVNTGKLDLDAQVDINSLAYVVKSENRYAKAYGTYLLGRVIRADDVQNLKEHKVAITADCMLYQNYAVRKIDERVYNTPFIGAHAIEIQLKNKEAELETLKEDIKEANLRFDVCRNIIEKLEVCNPDVLKENLNAPKELAENEGHLKKEKDELKKAQENPSLIHLQMQVEECGRSVKSKDNDLSLLIKRIGELEVTRKSNFENMERKNETILALENNFSNLCERDTQTATTGMNKFVEQVKSKSPLTIIQNFSPLKNGLENKKRELERGLLEIQSGYCRKYDCDLGIGHEEINEYIEEHHKLVSADIIKYEEDLRKAKDNCHLEFKESFLAKLKENIENARIEFKNLNSALKDIYYGEDSYKFELTHNKQKESICQMIMSKNNFEGFNLWSTAFEEEYKEEMEDLFAKLTAYDDKGEKVLAEYTDYRSYLDYDIRVEKKDGSTQFFSKIYGEKSGGETQTPYYVAIAASFVQLYKLGDTIRIIMLDEAFDKMDDNRISSMMDFLNSQNFQIILATPPAKVEVIGEKVDTILMAIRSGSTSIIEEYDL